MSSPSAQTPKPAPVLTSAPITSIQPGGGWCMALELAWGRLRRWLLRRFEPEYVKKSVALRQGECPGCPHDIIDSRDLKYVRNVCGFSFDPATDPYRRRERGVFARVGLAEVVIASILFAGVIGLAWLATVFGLSQVVAALISTGILVAWLIVLYFFRDPERTPPTDPDLVLSPADGTVTDIAEVHEPGFASGRAMRIGIFLSVFNVHVNRSPRTARVLGLSYHPGKFLTALRKEAADVNEQMWMDLEDVATGVPIRVKQISGAFARRIVCWVRIGEALKAGDRFGMIKLGSRTELYLPCEADFEIKATVGQKVKGGLTVLALLHGVSKRS